jgi:phosphotransferase system, enzyme I, PtsP
VMVNINLLSDLALPGEEIADGVGLYRTEFPFIIRNDFPSEEEQFFVYRKLVEGMKGKPVTIRTLDIGGDKILTYYDDARENNPFLGMRSIRFSLAHRDIFRQQIRAILRAGHNADLRIMFPMIASMEDFIESKAIVTDCARELGEEGIPHNAAPPVGMMVELPSAVMVIEDLAREAAFFSIGTNDLVQYTLAVDRTNEKVAHLYVPHHPAVLRSIKRIADAGRAAAIEVSVCGDMANSVRYLPFLIGAGITAFSVDSVYLPRVKRAIAGINRAEAASAAGRILLLKSLREVEELLPEILPE